MMIYRLPLKMKDDCPVTDILHGSRKFCQRGSIFFLVDEGIEDPNTTINRPSSARQRNADDGPTLNAGLVAVIFRGSGPVLLRNPIFL